MFCYVSINQEPKEIPKVVTKLLYKNWHSQIILLAYVKFDAGAGQVAVDITKTPVSVAFFNLGDFAVCSEDVLALGQKTHVLHLFDAMGDRAKIPKNCAPVRLIPQCALLNVLPKGAAATHKYVQQVGCYDDVAAIDWTKYSDFNFHNL